MLAVLASSLSVLSGSAFPLNRPGMLLTQCAFPVSESLQGPGNSFLTSLSKMSPFPTESLFWDSLYLIATPVLCLVFLGTC